MLTITRKDLLLTVNDNVIPAMGSSDVPVKFVNDAETYVDFLIEPRVGYYVNGCPKSTVCEYDTSNNTFKIPAEAFKQRGVLVIAIALIDNEDSNHIEVTKELALEVTPAPNGTVILPATDTWQTAVSNLVEQLYNQDYKAQFDQIEEDLHNLVKEAQNQQNKANNQQTQIDNAIDIMGDYEIVQDNPTQIRFKKGNGTYGDTVNLGDNLASKSMVNAGYDIYSGNSYGGSASDYGIEIGKVSGSYKQVATNGYQLFDASKIPTKSTGGATVTNNGDGSWEPFTGGEPAPNPNYPLEPKFFEPKNGYSVGKNMFDKDNVVANNRVSGVDGTFLSQTGTYRTNYIDINSDFVSIFISGNKTSQTATSEVLAWYDNEKNFISGERMEKNGAFPNKSYEIPSNASYVIFNFRNEDIDEIQLSYGSTEQPYTPFVGQSAIPLNITLRALPNGVCDTYEDRVITRRVGYIEFDGSSDENWITDISVDVIRFKILTNNSQSGVIGAKRESCLSNRFKQNLGLTNNVGDCFMSDGLFYVITDQSITTVTQFKTWLQTHATGVWYQIATPTTEEVDLPVIPSYFPYTNAWHDSEVEASDLTWNILARQYGSGQTTIKKDEAVLTELDLNTQRTANTTTVKVQLQDSEGKVLYLETSSENVYIQSGRFSGKTVQQVLENSIQAISATDEYIEVDVPDSMTHSIDEEFLVDEVDESETETE